MKRTLLALVAILSLASSCTIIPTPPPAGPSGEVLPAPTDAPGGPTYAHVLFVQVTEESGGTWRLEVTVQHADEGDQHYADSWEALVPVGDGRTTRYLRSLERPHVGEMPLTRALGGVEVPEGITQFIVRAHDTKDGYGGQEVVVDLTKEAGPGFQVARK